jgi:hypothetical protein
MTQPNSNRNASSIGDRRPRAREIAPVFARRRRPKENRRAAREINCPKR